MIKITIFAIHSPFLLPFFRREEKREKNNQSRDFKSCLSARSIQGVVCFKKVGFFVYIQKHYQNHNLAPRNIKMSLIILILVTPYTESYSLTHKEPKRHMEVGKEGYDF